MLKDKIKSLAALKKIILRLKNKGKRIVFTNGCFDLLHLGHARYLEDAKRKGNVLIVGVNSDASVRRIKGSKRPIIKQADRLGLIAALESVDYVVVFNEETPLNLIKALKPDVLVKGSDWDAKKIVGSDFVKSYGAGVVTVKLTSGRSTTNLINKIAKTFRGKNSI